MQYHTIKNQEELDYILRNNLGVLLYFSRQTCNVGEALEPKVKKMLEAKFPKIPFYFVDMDQTPDVAAKYTVFVEPTILVIFDEKETIRKSRIISIPDLENAIKRIYDIAF